MGLTPSQIGSEETIVPVQLPTIILAGTLLCTVLRVRCKELGKCRKSGHQIINTHRMARDYAVLHHREQVHGPKRQVRLTNLTNVREELVLIHIRQQALTLDRFQAR